MTHLLKRGAFEIDGAFFLLEALETALGLIEIGKNQLGLDTSIAARTGAALIAGETGMTISSASRSRMSGSRLGSSAAPSFCSLGLGAKSRTVNSTGNFFFEP